jgi:hypothetical protein
MNIVICLLSIYGLAFAVKEIDGPFGVMSWARNKLMLNKYVGVFFYKLLNCYFCVGCWSGLVVYLLTAQSYKLSEGFLWCLTGAATSLMLDAAMTKMSSH